MFCTNCGAELSTNGNFCPYCGSRLETASASTSLMTKAISTAQSTNEYNLVLISKGSCNAVTAGDLLEDVFGYTDEESGTLVRMAPVVVAENMTLEEASTVAQMLTEYGMELSVTDGQDQYVELAGSANSSVFDNSGNLLTGVAAVIGALTVANRISSYRRFRKPSLMERIFRLNYQPAPPMYRRNFRPRLDAREVAPRRSIRRPAAPAPERRENRPAAHRPSNSGPSNGRPSGGAQHAGPSMHSNSGRSGGPSGSGRNGGPSGHGGPGRR